MSRLLVETVPVSPIQQNARILYIEGSRDAIVVDPGGEADKIIANLERLGLTPIAVWLTHSHLDHCGGVAPFLEKYPVPLYAHPADEDRRGTVEQTAAGYGIAPGVFVNCPEPSHPLLGGETLTLGDLEFQVFFTPGHCPGHVVFYQPESNVLIAGDTVFKGSIGRTDFPGCDHDELLASIREKIFTLPDETIIMSGHGQDTTVGVEKRTNPYV